MTGSLSRHTAARQAVPVRRGTSRRYARADAGWILLVVLLPLIGTLIYFLIRKPSEEEILRAQEAHVELQERSPSVHQRLPGE